MEYMTFYDVSQTGYHQWWFPAFGLIGIAAGLLGIWYKSRVIRYPSLILTFSVIWTLGTFLTTYSDYSRLSTALTESHCTIVEGTVTDFQLLPPDGIQKAESFTVAGTQFKYSSNTVTAGFNQMRSHGGPIQNSLRVRIHHLDGEIARLEIVPAM